MIKIKSLHSFAQDEYNYLLKIKNGEIIPATTGYRFIDSGLLGGTNTGDILTIAALSGVGKTTLALKTGYNIPILNNNCRTLLFSFEILGRKISSKLISNIKNLTLKDLYIKNKGIVKDNFDMFDKVGFDIVEKPCTITEIEEAIDKYCKKYKNDRVHVIIDHSLLVNNLKGDNDMETLIELANLCNSLKKDYNIVFMIISQLNDSMLKTERLRNKSGHYPNQTDIFGSRAIYHVSDFVTCGVYPFKLNLPRTSLKEAKYGNLELPLYVNTKSGQKKYLAYWHNIKVRFGRLSINPLIDDLKYSDFKELDKKVYDKFVEKYNLPQFTKETENE